jgi:NAD(P)-dependent dehydrogenase (short-subunit alcohol dehydrogenase family)
LKLGEYRRQHLASAGRGYVVVTGASSGIGRATALELDRIGFSVFGTVRRQTDADLLAQSASPRLRTLLMDVTDEPAIAAAAEQVAAIAGEAGLAGLVNNAGLGTFGPIEALPAVICAVSSRPT